MRTVGVPELVIVLLVFPVVGFPLWRIAKKMGYPGILGLTALVPLFNLVVFYYLAFSDWPVIRQRRSG